MKKRLFLCAVIFMPAFLFAQFTSKKESATPKVDTIANTVDLKLQLHSDTARARIVLFAKGETDQFLSWIDGYLVVKTYKFPNGQVAGNVGNIAYTLKWELIKPEGIFDIKVIEQPADKKSDGSTAKKQE
jgi:hypothetical protein